ncbi:MAG: LysR substrate-binding domain-containing protein [Burkholderiales bacterium]
MELRQLRYFVRIVDLGSLSKAAADLYVAQPALSKQVAALEAEFKAALLVRSPRGVVPTDAGIAFYRQAQAILRQVGRVADEVRAVEASPTGVIAVGMPFSASNILAPALVAAVRERLPGIRLAITEEGSGQLEGLLAGGRLDLSLLYERNRPSAQIDEQPLLVEELYLVTQAPGGRGEVTLADAARHRYILPGAQNSTRQVVEKAFAKAGLELLLAAEVDVPWTTKAMVAAGLGATILSRSALYPEQAGSGLAIRRIVRPAVTRGLNLCSGRGETPARAAAMVRDILEDVVHRLIDSGAWRGAVLARRRTAPAASTRPG